MREKKYIYGILIYIFRYYLYIYIHICQEVISAMKKKKAT